MRSVDTHIFLLFHRPSEVTGIMSRTEIQKNNYKSKKSNKNEEKDRTLEEIMQEMMDGNGAPGASSPDPKGKVSYSVASAASALHEGQALGADVLIVDPPRKGRLRVRCMQCKFIVLSFFLVADFAFIC